MGLLREDGTLDQYAYPAFRPRASYRLGVSAYGAALDVTAGRLYVAGASEGMLGLVFLTLSQGKLRGQVDELIEKMKSRQVDQDERFKKIADLLTKASPESTAWARS